MLPSLICYLWLQQQPIATQPPDAPPPSSAAPGSPEAPEVPPSPPPPPVENVQATPPPAPAPPPAPPPEPPNLQSAPPVEVPGLATQQNVRAPGASLMNPALSFILDGAFGYYGVHADDFASLGLPIAGDDPSNTNEGFTVQEIEVAAQAALDPYFEGAVFLTI